MPKLLEEARNLIRTRHYSYRTEEAYLYWIGQYIYFTASGAIRSHPLTTTTICVDLWIA